MISEQQSQLAIGETGFTNIDWFYRTAEYGILIGETTYWGQGYGTEATRTMLAYGFTHLNLHTIWLRVSSANPAGITAYTRAGFREAGRIRAGQVIDGQRWDIVYMDCLATEFQSST